MAGYIGSKSSGIISGIDASIADLNLTDKASANGTTEANKVLTADANKDVTAIRNLTATGDVTAGGAVAVTGNVTAGGSVTATGTVTRALTRGSIDVGNSSGVSSALAKGAAGTVLTSDGTDLSFVEASGGGEQTFTAKGAVANGDIVGLNTDGTISVMTQISGSFATVNADAMADPSVAYDSTNNKIIYLYIDDANNDNPYVVIGTVSGMSISFGTPVQVANVDATYTEVVFDSNAGKFVAIYTLSSSVKCKVGTVSGTSCSFGSEATVQSQTVGSGERSTSACYDSGSNKIIFFAVGNSNYANINVGDISGTSISWGSTASVGGTTIRAPRVTYDSTANKVICVYAEAVTSAYAVKYRVCTVSGTSITLGTEGAVSNGTTSITSGGMLGIQYSSAKNRTFIVGNFAAPSYSSVIVASLSGTTLTLGTPVTSSVSLSSGGFVSLQDSPDFGGVLLAMNYYNEINFCNITCVSNTTTPIVFGQKQIANGNLYYYGSDLAYDTTANKMVFVTMNDSDGDKPTTFVFDPLVPDRWVGLAAEAISDGASGKVTVISGVNTGQSGLTVGVEYRVLSSSNSLVTLGGTIIGVATSTSSIYLTKAEIL